MNPSTITSFDEYESEYKKSIENPENGGKSKQNSLTGTKNGMMSLAVVLRKVMSGGSRVEN